MADGFGMIRMMTLAAVVLVPLLVAACGKKAAPEPPGPPDQITYPHTYPSR
jgi:hypothetical protein